MSRINYTMLFVGIVLICVGGIMIGRAIGLTEGRQSVEAVACEPSVVGLRKNGKEIPLTSAQRDSLAMGGR